jgi:hypothetical protein
LNDADELFTGGVIVTRDLVLSFLLDGLLDGFLASLLDFCLLEQSSLKDIVSSDCCCD